MNPGDLRHQVYLQGLTRTEDEGGGGAEVWGDDAGPIWAEVRPLSGNEALRAMQAEATVTHQVTMRYRPGVTTGMRIRFGTRYLDIRRVIDPEERRVELQLLCEELA
jgi:SPP1 family predicted phage head-tail adaptor